MNTLTTKHDAIQHLILQHQVAQTYYLQLSLAVSNHQLSRWFKLYSERKNDCIKKLEKILEKLGCATGPSAYPPPLNKTKPVELRLLSNKKECLISATRNQEKELIQLYTDLVAKNDLPDSIQLALLRHREQIDLALRYLDQIAT